MITKLIFLSVVVFVSLKNLKHQPQHVRDIVRRNFPPVTEHTLWRNWENLNYRKAYYGGVVGPQWRPTLADNSQLRVASPLAKVESKKIIANELPRRTLSESSFDIPKREDVVQITLPQSSMKSVESVYDPNNRMKIIPTSPTGTLYHGINVLPKKITTFGYPSAYRFKLESQNESLKRESHQEIRETLAKGESSEERADKLLSSITDDMVKTKMVLPVITTNKNEKPSLKIPYQNHGLEERKKELLNLNVFKIDKGFKQ